MEATRTKQKMSESFICTCGRQVILCGEAARDPRTKCFECLGATTLQIDSDGTLLLKKPRTR